MQTAQTAVKSYALRTDRHGHVGTRHLLVAEGESEWRYERVTAEQLRYWTHLTDHERNLLEWRLRGLCFQCGLRQAMRMEKRFTDGLYSALMTPLLLPVGDTARRPRLPRRLPA